ncbi:hypothetical protein JCM10207_007607 [Rhodosporidiobolus poonsookiae]
MRWTAPAALLACTLATSVSAGPVQQLTQAGTGLVRRGLGKFGLNDTQIDRLLIGSATTLEPSPYAVDLTDANWATLLATGTDNPFAKPLGDEDIWVVTVWGSDPVSKPYLEAMDEVMKTNSSAAGGPLPENMRFARLSYNKETVLPTKWWLWRPPVIVVGTNRMRTLRFISPGQMRPVTGEISEVLSRPELWQKAQVWEGLFAPGGKYEPYLDKVAHYWSKFHSASSRLPNFVLLAFSGFLLNFVVGYFHQDDAKLQVEHNKRVAQLQAKAAGSAASAKPSTSSSTAVAGKKGTKRK